MGIRGQNLCLLTEKTNSLIGLCQNSRAKTVFPIAKKTQRFRSSKRLYRKLSIAKVCIFAIENVIYFKYFFGVLETQGGGDTLFFRDT